MTETQIDAGRVIEFLHKDIEKLRDEMMILDRKLDKLIADVNGLPNAMKIYDRVTNFAQGINWIGWVMIRLAAIFGAYAVITQYLKVKG